MHKSAATTPTTFVPRELGSVRKQFGKSGTDVTPAAGVDPDGPRFLAAQLQHRISNAVREALLARGSNLEQFAAKQKVAVPGMSYDRLVRVLRGETTMQIADLVSFAREFEPVRDLLLSEQTWPTPTIQTNDDASTSDQRQ